MGKKINKKKEEKKNPQWKDHLCFSQLHSRLGIPSSALPEVQELPWKGRDFSAIHIGKGFLKLNWGSGAFPQGSVHSSLSRNGLLGEAPTLARSPPGMEMLPAPFLLPSCSMEKPWNLESVPGICAFGSFCGSKNCSHVPRGAGCVCMSLAVTYPGFLGAGTGVVI